MREIEEIRSKIKTYFQAEGKEPNAIFISTDVFLKILQDEECKDVLTFNGYSKLLFGLFFYKIEGNDHIQVGRTI